MYCGKMKAVNCIVYKISAAPHPLSNQVAEMKCCALASAQGLWLCMAKCCSQGPLCAALELLRAAQKGALEVGRAVPGHSVSRRWGLSPRAALESGCRLLPAPGPGLPCGGAVGFSKCWLSLLFISLQAWSLAVVCPWGSDGSCWLARGFSMDPLCSWMCLEFACRYLF